MLKDSFTVISSKGVYMEDMTVDLRCRKCEHYFSVDTNLIKPKNCSFVIGENITITCPSCKTQVKVDMNPINDVPTTNEKPGDAELFNLAALKSALVADLDIIDGGLNYGDIDISCKCCSNKFIVNMSMGFNLFVAQNGAFIKCPFCDKTVQLSVSDFALITAYDAASVKAIITQTLSTQSKEK